MSDLLAKCDWHGDELRVELPQWPEVVTVWVNGKAMPFVPVTDPDMIGAIKCLQGLAEATGEENANLRELVQDMWEYMTTPCNDYCERCVVAEECSERQDYDYCQWRDECVKRMRELGVGL